MVNLEWRTLRICVQAGGKFYSRLSRAELEMWSRVLWVPKKNITTHWWQQYPTGHWNLEVIWMCTEVPSEHWIAGMKCEIGT